MKNMKLIFVVIFFLMASVFAYTQQCDPETHFVINIIDHGRAISIIDYIGNKTFVNIPPRIQNLPVTTIGFTSFKEKNIFNVIIPNSVTSIEGGAFNGNKLTNVTIPNSVISIKSFAFANNQLDNILIPKSVIEIGSSAFANNKLTNITIPNSISKIGDKAFFGNQLTSITIEGNLNLTVDRGYMGFGDNKTKLQSRGIVPFGNGFEKIYTIWDTMGNNIGTYTRPNNNSTEWRKQ